MVQQQHFTILDASRYTGITTDGLRARVKRGEIPVMKVGNRIFIDRAALDDLMHARLVSK